MTAKPIPIPIRRGRQKKLAGQPMQERHGNPKKIKSVSAKTDRSYKIAPKAPTGMAEAGREYWREHAPGLVALNRLNRDTRPLFEQLCNAWATWMEWKDINLKRHDEGFSILEGPKAAKACMDWEVHFSKLFEKFLDISAQYERKVKKFSVWND